MITLDTSVVVRFLVQDDADQSARATALFAKLTPDEPGFLPREVVVELVWVLDRAYGYSRGAICDALDALLEAAELVIEADARVGRAVHAWRGGGAGFADRMILAAAAAHEADLVTFDRQLATLPGARAVPPA